MTILDRIAQQRDGIPSEPQIPVIERSEPDEVATKAEAGLYSEAGVIEAQARQARPTQDAENLLQAASASTSVEKTSDGNN